MACVRLQNAGSASERQESFPPIPSRHRDYRKFFPKSKPSKEIAVPGVHRHWLTERDLRRQYSRYLYSTLMTGPNASDAAHSEATDEFGMQASATPFCDTWPWAPHRCPRCFRMDTIPMPAEHLLDKLIGLIRYSPFKCRACRAKFYRRSDTLPRPSAPASQSAPLPSVAVCQRDRAVTRQRIEQIIRVAESARLRRG